MEWIEFSDIIGIVIVIYVSALSYTNHHIMKDVKLGFLFSGLALFILYCFDMSWYVMYYKCAPSPRTDFMLNFVTCMVYLMMPVALISFSTIYAHIKRKVRHYVGLDAIILLAIADVANIFFPILFYHEDSQMIFLPMGFWLHILCFVAFIILLIDLINEQSVDYEDTFLVTFVGITMLIGLLASWINYDVKTLWIAIGISYLLTYLAIAELYNKRDAITGLPNRNAFEKFSAYIKKDYSSILMVDMNSLKKYNDTMGHITGDKYIYATAKTIDDAFAGHGKLYRVGGDEFCLVSKSSKEELTEIAEQILRTGCCKKEYGDFPISFAYGIATRAEGDSLSDVFAKADQLMYENKSASKAMLKRRKDD